MHRAARPRVPGTHRAAPAILAAMALLLPRAAWAHAGRGATPGDVWHHWSGNPVEILLVFLPAIWYAVGVRALWRRAGAGHGVSTGQTLAFGAGILTLAVALLTPLDAMAEALFSVHMIQHLLLILVAAPLFVAGAPLVPALMVLAPARRVSIGRWWMRRAPLRHALHRLTSPGVVFLLHMVALWVWHFPLPYQAALRDPVTHALEHVSFFGTAVLFWWTVAPPTGVPRARDGAGIMLVGGTLMQSGVLGALLMLARTPWYPAHGEGARAWGTTLLQDQQLAGLIMWVPASAVYVAASAWLFLRWMHRDERLTAAAVPRLAPRLEEASS